MSEMNFIRSKGELCNHWTGMKCPCGLQQMGTNYPVDPNRADPSCQICDGLGWLWIPQPQVYGLVQQIQQHKDLVEAGLANSGDLVFSPQVSNGISDYDKIQLTWPQGIPYEGEIITRGSGTTDTSYYGIVNVPPGECLSVIPSMGIVTTYEAGVDFSFEGTTITWGLSSNQPSPGTPYSIKYHALLDWMCFVVDQPRRERQTPLGQRVVLKKKHTIFNGV